MNIQTVIANLLNTIEGKEQMLAYQREAALNSTGIAHHVNAVTAQFLKVNLDELNAILADCMAVREAGIVRELEINDAIRKGLEKVDTTPPKGTYDY